MGVVAARRYAQALLELAIDNGAVEQWQTDVDRVAELFATAEFRNLSRNSSVPTAKKLAVLASALEPPVAPLVMKFAQLAVHKSLVDELSEVGRQYKDLAAARAGVVAVDAYSAIPLTEALTAKLSSAIAGATGNKKVEVVGHIDRSVIGGIKFRVGDKLVDGSVQGKLSRMRAELC